MSRPPAAELGVYIISDGTTKIPTGSNFGHPISSNLSVLNLISKDFKIADLVTIGGSLDLG